MSRFQSFQNRLTAIVLLLLGTSQLTLATNPPDQLTIYRDPGPANTITLRWNQPAPGTFTYRIYRHTALASLSTSNPPLNSFSSAAATLTQTDAVLPAVTSGFYLVTADDGSPGGESLGLDTVGYTQVSALGGTPPGVYSTFGIAFMTWDVSAGTPSYGVPSSKPSDIFADQVNCGLLTTADRIIDMNNGQFAVRNSAFACAWTGTLETVGMTFGHGFWFNNRSAAKTIIECGRVFRGTPYYTATFPAGMMSAPSQTPYAWREPLVMPINQLELHTLGFHGGNLITDIADSDFVLSLGPIGLGDIAYYTNAGGWGGSLTQIIPGQAYRIINKYGSWNYNYQFNGTP